MATMIRPSISIKNKYHIDKHRHYELKHFCLQYPSWKRSYSDLTNGISTSKFERMPRTNAPGDPTANNAIKRTYYLERMKLIEQTAKEADDLLHDYILKAVTEDLSYTHLKSKLEIPCSRDMYYDRYRRFFWLLNEARN